MVYERWTSDDDDLLRKVYTTGSKSEILSALGKRWLTIYRRARRLGLVRPKALINEDKKKRSMRKDAWTTEQEELLRKVYPNGTKAEIISAMKRSWRGIWSRAYRLGLRRNRDIIRKETKEFLATHHARKGSWSVEDLQALQSLYRTERKAFILEKIKKPWSTIRYKAWSLGLRRSDEAIKADNILGTSAACMRKHGVPYTTLIPEMQNKSRQTNLRIRGVEYPSQNEEVREKIQNSVQNRYGVSNVFESNEVKRKIRETNLRKYGHESPMQNPVVREAALDTVRKNNSFALSDEEAQFYVYLSEIDSHTECQVTHPIVGCNIDFYMPGLNLWVQYDGAFWHGVYNFDPSTPRGSNIQKTMKRDLEQNEAIPNLVRFSSEEVKKAIYNGTIREFITNKLNEKAHTCVPCHQYSRKMELLQEDLKSLQFDPHVLKASDFSLANETYTKELADFIVRYEWLGTVGNNPRWSFTARYQGVLGGVVLINEPNAYSNLLGSANISMEALIQRGATASWTPKNLGSRLVMFSCRWMVENTNKRVFVGYGDPKANEIGTIYQACNFDYLGDNFGTGSLYIHKDVKNGRAFSEQSLKRTSAFKQWCRTNGITLQPSWFKKNGYKNLKEIPEHIKSSWAESIRRTISEATRIPVGKKHKYALVLAKNRRELNFLRNQRTYDPKPYPKRNTDSIVSSAVPAFTNAKENGNRIKRTNPKSRITPEKDRIIIEQHASKTKKELAKILNETERWVDSRIRHLLHTGDLVPKKPLGSTKSRITDQKITFLIDNMDTMTYQEMANKLGETKRWVKRQMHNIYRRKLL